MSAAKTIYLFVNGIATWPGNFTNWNKRAVTFTHTHTDFRAEAFEYFTTPLTRPFKEDQRAKHFARAIKEYSQAGWNIICVGQPSAGWMPVFLADGHQELPPLEPASERMPRQNVSGRPRRAL
jgi:hypothetical protein